MTTGTATGCAGPLGGRCARSGRGWLHAAAPCRHPCGSDPGGPRRSCSPAAFGSPKQPGVTSRPRRHLETLSTIAMNPMNDPESLPSRARHGCFSLDDRRVLGSLRGLSAYRPGGMNDPVNGRYKAFLFVGVAYFLTAVLAPLAVLALNGASWTFTAAGLAGRWWRGSRGAGAFGVLLAFGAKGTPAVVMSIVFAGAPVVNALYALTLIPRQAGGKSCRGRSFGNRPGGGGRLPGLALQTGALRRRASRRTAGAIGWDIAPGSRLITAGRPEGTAAKLRCHPSPWIAGCPVEGVAGRLRRAGRDRAPAPESCGSCCERSCPPIRFYARKLGTVRATACG